MKSNFYSTTSKRLTPDGLMRMSKKEEHYAIYLNKPLNGRQLAQLTQLLDFPYFISGKMFVIFSDINKFYLKINGNDIPSWLDSLDTDC